MVNEASQYSDTQVPDSWSRIQYCKCLQMAWQTLAMNTYQDRWMVPTLSISSVSKSAQLPQTENHTRILNYAKEKESNEIHTGDLLAVFGQH